MERFFTRVATAIATAAGQPFAFVLAFLIILLWGVIGPVFHFSDTWQLVVNTGTTIVTFLMVFLIQNTQNRDSLAMHLKLDEIIRAIDTADDDLIRAEDETDEELALLKKRYQQVMIEQQAIKARIAERVGD